MHTSEADGTMENKLVDYKQSQNSGQ
jgi:hypothetical protein